jgi:hypothetical protein
VQDLEHPEKSDAVMKKILGMDYDFFNVISATNDKDYSKFLGYLAYKDEKFLILVSLYCWIYAPFLSHLYKLSNKETKDKRLEISKLMMYGIFYVLQGFFQAHDKNLLSHEILLDLQADLQQNILKTLQNVCTEILDRPIYNVDWFSFPIGNLLDSLNQDFYSYWEKKKYPQKKLEEMKMFGKDLNQFIENFQDYFKELNEKNNPYFYYLMKLFMPYFYGTSGLDLFNNEIIDKLLHSFFNENYVWEYFLELHMGTKKRSLGSSIIKGKDIYNGILQLSMVGFHIIEKMKNYSPSKAEEFLKIILENL